MLVCVYVYSCMFWGFEVEREGKGGGVDLYIRGRKTYVNPLIKVNSCLIVPPCALAVSLALFFYKKNFSTYVSFHFLRDSLRK